MLDDTLVENVIEIAEKAAEKILDIYAQEFKVHDKSDGSPVTVADQAAHDVICSHLKDLIPGCPILSEESLDREKEQRLSWPRFWLVDPLDGTKEFINKNGEFTVNIALIDGTRPVLGVVNTPAQGITHYARSGKGAFKRDVNGTQRIFCSKVNNNSATLVASRSHAGVAVEKFKNAMELDWPVVNTTSMGSALKICLVAEGAADIYPRLGLTSEWDTAAAHCVLDEAGGAMLTTNGDVVQYNKPDTLLNPWFLAIGDPDHNWLKYHATETD